MRKEKEMEENKKGGKGNPEEFMLECEVFEWRKSELWEMKGSVKVSMEASN